MRKLSLGLIAGLALFQFSVSAEWLEDLSKAQAQAKTEKKLVLVNFTGSDWCGFCKVLDKEVFSTPEFKEYAKKHFVLMEADFPHGKPQSDALKKANADLKAKFKVSGFPTLVVLDAEGKKLGQKVGYPPGSGSKAVIAELDKMMKH